MRFHLARRRWLLLTIAVVVLVALFVIRPSGAPDHFDAAGTIRARLDDGRLIVAHDEIPGLMPPMTMAFTIDPAEEEGNASQPGDRIRFRIQADDLTRISHVRVIGRAASPATPPPAARPRPARLREGDAVIPFTLVDQHNQPLSADDLRGQFTLITFIFTRCPVPEFCPAMMLRFGEIQAALAADPELGERVRLWSITLDPEYDQPAVLHDYGQSVGADFERWRFATGNKEQIDALAAAFAVFREFNGVTLDHTLATALIGPDGSIRSIWRGHGWKSAEVIAALNDA